MNKPDKFPFVSPDMSNEDYHRGEWQKEFISSTQIKRYLVSPKYFQFIREHPEADTVGLEASMQGSVYHSMLASLVNKGDLMADFKDEFFVFEPPVNPKTGKPYGIDSNAYREVYEQALLEHPGMSATSEAEVGKAKAMINCLLNACGRTSAAVKQLIEWGTAETSFFVEYEGWGFKVRTDLQTQNKIVDWKTISAPDLHLSTVTRQINKLHYGISAAFYQFFIHEITGQWKEFYWVFQQKEAPYDAVLVSASDIAYSWNEEQQHLRIGNAAAQFEMLLAEHLRCHSSGYFPGAEVFLLPSFSGQRIMYAHPDNYASLDTTFYED